MSSSPAPDAELLATENYLGGTVPPVEYLRLHVSQTGGQTRRQQEEMLSSVAKAITDSRHLAVQAGTGTGKSLAYAFAAAASGKRTVISTATNQLGEQLANKDLPEVVSVLESAGKHVTHALLKGRNNYVCKAKTKDIAALGNREADAGLFDLPDTDTQSELFRTLFAWAETTDTGDRSDGPPVPNHLWKQVSVSSSECAGANCPFYDECFAEEARKKAKAATIVLTNHSLVAQDIRRAMEPLHGAAAPSVFGEAPVLVIDEAHSFAETVTNAFSVTVDPSASLNTLPKFHSLVDDSGDDGKSVCVSRLIHSVEALESVLSDLTPGVVTILPDTLRHALNKVAHDSIQVARELQRAQTESSTNPRRALSILSAVGQIADLAGAAVEALNEGPGTVQWISETKEKRTLNVAPIDVGETIANWIDQTNRTVIATSATMTVGESFEPMKRSLGLMGCESKDVGTPFAYSKQGILYVPAPPFPAPIGKDRVEHTERVLDEIVTLVGAAGGRSLVLFTTTAGAVRGAETLRHAYPALNVLCHGDAPADALVNEFRDDEHSVLCATMGLWHGVDVPGPSCSLVIIDKVPFAPMDDAVSNARRVAADDSGRNGFLDVYVADAAVDLAQAAGRLIRRSDDKGVVAILDPRLHTKFYGATILNSLPPFSRSKDGAAVAAALTRLTGGLPEELNSAPTRRRKQPVRKKSTKSPAGSGTSVGKRRPRKRTPRRSPEN